MTAIHLPPSFQGPTGATGPTGPQGPQGVNPPRYSFRAYRSAAGAISGTGPTTITLDIEVFDPDNAFAASQYVCPVDGLYMFVVRISYNYTTTFGTCTTFLYRNGANDTINVLDCTRQTAFQNGFSTLVSAVAGDAFTLVGGSSVSGIAVRAGAAETYMAGCYLGSPA